MTLKVEISAETKEQASDILNVLLEQKLVTGGQFIESPARFLWKGEVTDMNYVTTTSFTLPKHKNAIISEVGKVSKEEVPMIAFLPFEGNKKLERWIEDTCA